jgi:uncharacterized protein
VYIKREIEETILKVSESFPCIAVYGPRQVGKSTTVDYLFGEHFKSVTLDNLEDRILAQTNPRIFLETYGFPLIIDEIQKAPMLLDAIKIVIDNKRKDWLKNGEKPQLLYILTGSNRFELQQGISDSLAGRCGIIDMASLSQMEKYGEKGNLFTPDISILLERERKSTFKSKTRKEVFESIFTGGMPDIVVGNAQRDIYFKSYVSTYIEKDVRLLIAAKHETTFRNFMSLVALRTAREVHYEELSSSLAIDVRTCKEWISILETAGIVYLLQPFMTNLSSRIIKASKLYFMDTGLCAYLCKWPDAEMLSNGAMSGEFFETFVVSEIVKNLYSHGVDPKEHMFYYRDKDQKEIDLIYTEREKVYPIEIKAGIAPQKSTRNFSSLNKYKLNVQPGLVIDSSDKIRPIDEKSYFYPVSRLGE